MKPEDHPTQKVLISEATRVSIETTITLEKMKGNKTMHNCESKYVADIKFAIKSGELEPSYLELPAIPEYLKKKFAEHYEGGKLQLLKTTKGTTYRDSLMYFDMYAWYQESKKGELNDKPF